VLISDMLNEPDKTLAALKLLKFQRHDVMVLQVLDRSEIEFRFHRPTRFVGLEGLPSVAADPRFVGGAYRRAMQQFLDTLRSGCQQMGMDYHLLLTDQSLAMALAHVLANRKKAMP
jgi:hypothetical protein